MHIISLVKLNKITNNKHPKRKNPEITNPAMFHLNQHMPRPSFINIKPRPSKQIKKLGYLSNKNIINLDNK